MVEFIGFDPSKYVDVRSSESSAEMKVAIPNRQILFDAANLVFVCLPQIEKNSGKMYIPGIQENGAWIHVFDPIELKKGSGVLFFNSNHNRYEQKPFSAGVKFNKPISEVFAEKLGIEKSSPTDLELQVELLFQTDASLASRIVANLDLPKIITGLNLENPQKAIEFVKALLKFQQFNRPFKKDQIDEITQLHNWFADFFISIVPRNNLYRYGRPLVAKYKQPPSLFSNEGSLTLI